jgi:hypothetical protein
MPKDQTAIYANGEVIVTGDEGSLAVIFKNLSGENFVNPPVWRTYGHAEYIEMMQTELKCNLKNTEITLINKDGKIINRCALA